MNGISGRAAVGPSDVELAADGDELAFARLVDAHYRDMSRVAYVVTGDSALAQDAVQSAWTIAWRKLGSVRDPEHPRPWLLAIAVNEARQIARKRRRVAVVEIDPELAAAPRTDPAVGIARLDLVARSDTSRPTTGPCSRCVMSSASTRPSSDRSPVERHPARGPGSRVSRRPCEGSSAMTDHELFDARLADALRMYADEAPRVDSIDFAHAIAAGHPRRRGWSRLIADPRMRLALALLGLALALVSIVALAAVGSRRADLAVDPGFPVPAGLYGEWDADLAGPDGQRGTYTLDLNAPTLVRLFGGSTQDWAGRVVAVVTNNQTQPTVVVRSSGACGEGRYLLREDPGQVTPVDPEAPSASRGPSADPDIPTPGPSRPPDQWVAFRLTDPTDECADRAAILTNTPWTRSVLGYLPSPKLGPFVAGQTYDSGSFTQPFRFVMPAVDNQGDNEGLADQFRFASRYVSDGGLQFGGVWWSMRLIDDLAVQADLCDTTSAIRSDIPATPEAVDEWLHAIPGLTVSEPVEVPVDGRTALRFDIDAERCDDMARLPLGGLYGYLMRAYAIPTGDDTILLVGGSDGVNYEAVKAAMDAFVRSMDFQ